jgi:RNA polymerase primary sigma factor
MRQLKISKSITNRESPSLEKYLYEIGKESMITAEEEVLLAQRIRNGDTIALNKLTKANLRFVVSVAKQYQNQGLTLNDLINEGNLGLIKAARRFDETKGFKFISYAVWWIRQSILQALAEQGRLVRLPLNKVGLNSKITKISNQLEQEFQREPSSQELSNILEISEDDIENSINGNFRHISLDAPVSQGEDLFLYDVLINPNAEQTDSLVDYKESLQLEIDRALSTLTTRQAQVICMYFGLKDYQAMSLEDIGNEFDLTRERVRQIKDKALLKLKTAGKTKLLKNFLGN